MLCSLHWRKSDDPGMIQAEVVRVRETDVTLPGQKQVEDVLTFWDTVCWSGSIKCDGQSAAFSVDGGDVG